MQADQNPLGSGATSSEHVTRMAPLEAAVARPLEGGPSFSLRVRATRAAWNVSWFLLASWTPSPMRFARRALLRLFGAQLGARSDVHGSARVWLPSNLVMEDNAVLAGGVKCYNQATITVRRDAIVSQGAYLCCGTHDIDDRHFQLVARPIDLGPGCWIASEAFVGPGVTVGQGAVLGARGVATKNLDPWGVYVGNPARLVRKRKAHQG